MRVRLSKSVAAVVVLVVAAVVGIYLVGRANPIPRAAIHTDELGPFDGEPVAHYVAAAQFSLAHADASVDAWALVSVTTPLDPEQVWRDLNSVRVSQLLIRVPIERVQTQLIAVPTAQNKDSITNANDVAAGLISAGVGPGQRAAAVAAVSAVRLRAGCACTVGVVVRGTGAQLRAVAHAPGIRAIQVLPPDAVGGGFSVAPLLPTFGAFALAGPDDGAIPAR